MSDLKPCPFCGGEAIISVVEDAKASGESFEMPQPAKIEPVKHDARVRRKGGS